MVCRISDCGFGFGCVVFVFVGCVGYIEELCLEWFFFGVLCAVFPMLVLGLFYWFVITPGCLVFAVGFAYTCVK